jgi:hypothetical protein
MLSAILFSQLVLRSFEQLLHARISPKNLNSIFLQDFPYGISLATSGFGGIGQRYRRPVNATVSFRWACAGLLTCLALVVTQGCARPDAFRRNATAAGPNSGRQNLPFHPSAERTTDDADRPAVPLDHKTPNAAPFRITSHPRLPAGTLLTVRLENSFSIAQAHVGEAFNASLAAPITIDGETLIPGGAPVSGRVESVQTPLDGVGTAPKTALVRLTLNTLTIDGKRLPLQTSSLFAKATLWQNASAQSPGSERSSGDYRLQKGRRLTFRLTSPLALSEANSVADGQYPDSSR